MEPIDIEINPGRLLYGLSRIGYTTSSALCDIIDNSVRANASEINLVVEKEKKSFSDSRKNNVLEYLVIDNGDGMEFRRAMYWKLSLQKSTESLINSSCPSQK